MVNGFCDAYIKNFFGGMNIFNYRELWVMFKNASNCKVFHCHTLHILKAQ